MNRCTLEMNTGESLTFAIDTEGLCGICMKEPHAERLTMKIGHNQRGKQEVVEVTMCRHCLGEHAPQMLAVLEGKA